MRYNNLMTKVNWECELVKKSKLAQPLQCWEGVGATYYEYSNDFYNNKCYISRG